jgi:hypothetical protein
LARLMKAWPVTMSSGGREKQSRVRSFAESWRRRTASTTPMIRTASGIGPKTPNCDPTNAAISAMLNSCTPLQAALAAVCWNVAKPCVAFHARLGARTAANAASAAAAAGRVQAARAARDSARWIARPTTK